MWLVVIVPVVQFALHVDPSPQLAPLTVVDAATPPPNNVPEVLFQVGTNPTVDVPGPETLPPPPPDPHADPVPAMMPEEFTCKHCVDPVIGVVIVPVKVGLATVLLLSVWVSVVPTIVPDGAANPAARRVPEILLHVGIKSTVDDPGPLTSPLPLLVHAVRLVTLPLTTLKQYVSVANPIADIHDGEINVYGGLGLIDRISAKVTGVAEVGTIHCSAPVAQPDWVRL